MSKKERIAPKQAEAVWRDSRFRTTEAALKQMHGWSCATAYRWFGPRGVHRGRPPKGETDA